jgi:L-ectoine synthase
MIIRYVEDLKGTDREVAHGNWVSRRFILRKDKMGFSFHETIIKGGTESHFWYANHFEAVYCVAGKGKLIDKATGEEHEIRDGMLYGLNEHDKHAVIAETDLRLICAFYPPVTGREVHDENGVYPLIEEDDDE